MTVNRTYTCNLCRDVYESNELIGLHWKTWPKGWVQAPAYQAENHICKTCLATLKKLATEQERGGKQ